ncbi:MAG: hypothetical protein EOP02_00250 [Proteobacteria bacterium]|nr:MAG: hypothetical protein EOP02_00250 [Pseudomonadota bacterium]
MSLINQLPRLSAYDPGAFGEGGLDPMGSGAVADRIANRLAPGLRARMGQPHFATISTIGAFACQTLRDLPCVDGKTTADIAFEWLVVESMVRSPIEGNKDGFPGNQKAMRARAVNERLSRRNYLSGPRVFGFTGVYRPFSRDIAVLTNDDLPAENAVRLVSAWERDHLLPGFVDGIASKAGGRLRRGITDVCKRTLERGECAAPVAGTLMPELAKYLATRNAGIHERSVLRQLICSGSHEIRNELAAKIVKGASFVANVSQRDLALQLMPGMSTPTRAALKAAIDYETVTTAIDNAFRRFLAHTTQQHGAVIGRTGALETPGLAALAPRVGVLAQCALDSVCALDDTSLANDAMQMLQSFARNFTAAEFFDVLLERHEHVQTRRNKLSWIDRIDDEWTVRTPYRSQSGQLDDNAWTHPMRLTTLAAFLAETA